MKGLLFFLVLFGVLFIAWSVSKEKEGFQDATPDGASPGPTIPLISPRYQTLTQGETKPFTEPSAELLAPPPGQSASINSQPSEDPAAQKADAKRIQSVYESMTGFFKTDAPGLQKMGDPSIQLPLATAKSDMGRLKDELDVLAKNPGLESSLTQDDVNAVEANLGYLQKKWRLSVNANSGAPSPMPPTEGFDDYSNSSIYGWFRSFFGGRQEGFQTSSSASASTTAGGPSSSSSSSSASTTAGGPSSSSASASTTAGGPSSSSSSSSDSTTAGGPSSSSSSSSSGSSASTGAGSNSITMADIDDLILKLNIEITRLSASGTTDANTQSRISVLSAIKQRIEDLKADIRSGVRTLASVPITKSDIARFLPAISNPNSAISDLLSDFGLQSVLSSLFPNYALGDVSGSEIAKQLFDKYMKDMTQNLSWDIELNYKGQAEQDIAANYASAMNDARYAVDNTGTPTASNSNGVPNTGVTRATNSVTGSAYRGLFESVISSVTGQDAKVSVGMGGAPSSSGSNSHSTEAPHFDWKARSTQICNQINARGLKAYDFGCLKSDAVVSDNFSWRGYTRMVCTRLATVYDPSIPDLCGCPPPSWLGWRP